MPFIALSNIRGLTLEGLISDFSANPAEFEKIEEEAGKIITRITGISSPAAVADAPDWAALHMANIITYLTCHKLGALSSEMVNQITAKYKETISFLNSVPTRGETTALEYSGSGSFTTVNTW